MINIATDSGAFANIGGAEHAIQQRAIEHSNRLFDVLEARLATEGPFLLGERFSAADIYLFMLSLWALPSERSLHVRCPNIEKVSRHVRLRPKLKSALESHGALAVAAEAA
jgi:glutathione S-transferase